jgi:hypothetical protein
MSTSLPGNREFLDWIGGEEEFSEEETALPLRNASLDALPATTPRKLKYLDLVDYFDSLARNLSVLFNKAE